MKVAAPEKRLAHGWGWVDRRHVELIAKHMRGSRVLDLGAGYGTTTAALGRGAVGVDRDEEVVTIARGLHPQATFHIASGDALPFPDAHFDTVVLRDALHHLINQDAWPRARAEMLRVLKPGARVVVLDPNPNWMVRVARKLARHQDEECSVDRARAALTAAGLRISHESYHTLYSLPLSGGYVGPELLPPWRPLWGFLLGAEQVLERVVSAVGLARFVSWRYLLVADRDERG